MHARSHADICMHLHAFAQTHITYMRPIGAMRYPRALSRMLLMLTASDFHAAMQSSHQPPTPLLSACRRRLVAKGDMTAVKNGW